MRLFVISLLALLCLPLPASAQSYKEGDTIPLAAPTWVLYGDVSTDRLLVRKLVGGQRKCTIGPSNFDSDPAPGIAKTCTISGTNGLIAEGQTFALDAGGIIWYGVGSKYTTYTVSAGNGKYTCDNSQAKADPAPGTPKFCRSAALLKYTLDTCSPSDLGGTGTKMAAGLTSGPLRFWAGWWCGVGEAARMQVVACEGSACFLGPAGAVLSGASKLWPTVATNATEAIDSPRLQKIWLPHLPEINALKPQ
jgi:hypothetical protein